VKVLVTRYKMRDLVAWYLSEYLERVVIPELDERGYVVIDLSEEYDSRYFFEESLKKNGDVFMVVFSGHGREDLVTGIGYEWICKACCNDHLLKGKIVHAASCLTAQVLGHSAVNKGASVYSGFVQPAYLVVGVDYEGPVSDCPLVDTYDPLEDKYAKPFLDTMFYPVIAFADGKDPVTVYFETYDRYNYWIKYSMETLSETKDACWLEVMKCLTWNRDNYVIYPVLEKKSALIPILCLIPTFLLTLSK